ncbi:Na/Pi symporter [Sediminitomix flava]|uniref:Sodium-dependent phosphate cotransporter n=1 Tax=Sediminitomix flava TaxID=379075 RepID=A0A315ZGV7_SEDFL|nr:Na/Pi symporter [Sediminitomix flava]PWJ44835.1 sodium-dependent phosphate cotransporter [Sediminitomix flava]
MKNSDTNKVLQTLSKVVQVVAVLFVFLVALKLMSGGFKMLSKDTAQQIITLTSNPFISLFVGLLATALIQSSSTTTSMIVAIVASGSLSLQNAVPMIMGANIGTSVTSTIVALGHLSNKDEFKKAISAATVHDFFNLIVMCVLFPIEYFTGALSSAGTAIASVIYSSESSGPELFNIMSVTVKPAAKAITALLNKNALVVIGVGTLGLFISLRLFTVVLKKLLVGNSEKRLEKYVFGKPLYSLVWGALITAGVQSSSVTTSLTVPLVASNKLSLRNAFPFLMGANIGTTVTALIAAVSQNEAALAIAFCHFLFNIFGVFILFPISAIRNIPIVCAELLGQLTMKNRLVGVAYILVIFFIIPFALIFATTDLNQEEESSLVTPVNPTEVTAKNS